MKKTAAIVAILALALLLCSCSAAPAYTPSAAAPPRDASYAVGEMSMTAPQPMPAPSYVKGDNAAAPDKMVPPIAPSPTSPPGVEMTGEKIIYNATITMQTTAFDEDHSRLENALAANGAHAQQSNISGMPFDQPNGYGRYAGITARVPAENYNALIAALRAIGENVNLSSYTSDITMQYMDSKARLTAYRAQMDKMNELIQKSDKIEDIIKIQGQVTDLMYQIESLEGQLRYQDNQVAYSTVTITLTEVQRKDIIIKTPETMGQRIGYVFYETLNGMINGGQSFLVWFIGRSPILVPLAAILVIVILLALRRQKKDNKPAPKQD